MIENTPANEDPTQPVVTTSETARVTTPRKSLDPAAVEVKLRELRGNQAAVARHFGVHRKTVNALVRKRPELRTACREAREAMKDNAESALQRAVIAGEPWAVRLYLKTQASDRGYVEKPADKRPKKATLVIVEEIVDADS